MHDQSPPRRISDYATANARALVAAQQRMQPLYFHYQVDCNRDETPEDEDHNGDDKRHQQSVPGTPRDNEVHELDCTVGPRLKRKDYRMKHVSNSPQSQSNKFQMVKKNADGTLQNIMTKPPRIARRAQNKPPRKTNSQSMKSKSLVGFITTVLCIHFAVMLRTQGTSHYSVQSNL